MRIWIFLVIVCGFVFFLNQADAQTPGGDKKAKKNPFGLPDVIMPSEAVLSQIAAKTDQLREKVAELRVNGKRKLAGNDRLTESLLPDVEIYLRAAENIVRFKEFYNKASGQWTLDALDTGLQRAEQLAKGKAPWTTLEKRNVLRAYRSGIDDTAQPFGVTYPLEYGKDPKRKWRVDLVLHGRNSSLTEVAFLNSHSGKKKIDPEQEWVQVDIFGRGNNAYRWAGEMDVMEAQSAFFREESWAKRSEFVEPRRVVLRGFSMGGAGTWHLGLRFPDFWSVMSPGAGFTTTHNYAWPGKKDLPDYQEKCLRIYDAINYVENASMIPIVAYSGGNDPQKLAADNIENRLKELKIGGMTHLVAPGVGHTFTPEYFKKANALWAEHAKPRPQFPKKVHFTTYSTKAPDAGWFSVFGMERQYEKAVVEAELMDDGCRFKTTNVSVLVPRLSRELFAPTIEIDGQKFKLGPKEAHDLINFVKTKGKWKLTSWDDLFDQIKKGQRKVMTRQGPIDDAFWGSFVCVAGTGETWHPATQKFVDAKLAAFKHDWAKHWRGELPLTNEYGITPNEIMEKHLILFGDPSSNFLLANILPKLPLKWTKDEIEFAGKKYKTSEHVPVMIFPNPLNPMNYVVLNSGHTWPSEDYYKTNALSFPRLGDYAILKMTPTAKDAAAFEVATAGLFDEFWRVEK